MSGASSPFRWHLHHVDVACSQQWVWPQSGASSDGDLPQPVQDLPQGWSSPMALPCARGSRSRRSRPGRCTTN